jgi:hypothetical protein
MDEFIGFMFTIGFVGVLSFATGQKDARIEMEKEIIQHGYGLYCPDTAKFAYNGECDKIAK